MIKRQALFERLIQWYQRQKRALPWRDRPDPYFVWVSEIMLQQTQVKTVLPYFESFICKFPTVNDLAKAPLESVLVAWSGLGYYSRARNLHAAANQIVQQGGFPQSRDQWQTLPGIGPYTAGAIASIAGNQPEPILDGNVERVLARFQAMGASRGEGAYKKRLWRLSEWMVKQAYGLGIAPRDFNQALMELGALVCAPKSPQCLLCPWQGLCRAQDLGKVEAYPLKKAGKPWIYLEERLHGLLDASGQVLLASSESGPWRKGLWDLPAKIPMPLKERKKLKYLGQVEVNYTVTRHRVRRLIRVWEMPQTGWVAREKEVASCRWIQLASEPGVPVGAPLKKAWIKMRARQRSVRAAPVLPKRGR